MKIILKFHSETLRFVCLCILHKYVYYTMYADMSDTLRIIIAD